MWPDQFDSQSKRDMSRLSSSLFQMMRLATLSSRGITDMRWPCIYKILVEYGEWVEKDVDTLELEI